MRREVVRGEVMRREVMRREVVRKSCGGRRFRPSLCRPSRCGRLTLGHEASDRRGITLAERERVGEASGLGVTAELAERGDPQAVPLVAENPRGEAPAVALGERERSPGVAPGERSPRGCDEIVLGA